LQRLGEIKGVNFQFNEKVEELIEKNKKILGVRLKGGRELFADFIIFNGDPKAIFNNLLGKTVSSRIHTKNIFPRSLSAYVWSFAAHTKNRGMSHHNVFFNDNYESEFEDISNGIMPQNPTLYVCAEDRGTNMDLKTTERFEIIMNAGSVQNKKINSKEEFNLCQKITFETLEKMSLKFNPLPQQQSLTTPTIFNRMFPGSDGSLYGLNPNNLLSTFKRPKVRSPIRGLYLVGGGVHPGPGIPMAMLSGQHAAEVILRDHFLI
jgi:1-hydroxycarotenoid 3,4-desaturase